MATWSASTVLAVVIVGVVLVSSSYLYLSPAAPKSRTTTGSTTFVRNETKTTTSSTPFPSGEPTNGVTIDHSSRASIFRADYQPHFCYAGGLTWVFYYNGTSFVYQTSADGRVWANRTPISTSGSKGGGSIALTCDQNGNFVYFVPQLGATNLYHRAGVLTSNGTIVWSGPEQVLTTTYDLYYFGAAVTWDGPGYPASRSPNANTWVFVATQTLNDTFHSEVWRISADGVVSKSLDIAWSDGYVSAELVPLGGGKIGLVGSEDGNGGPYFFDFFNGSSWMGVHSEAAQGFFWEGSCAPDVQGSSARVLCVIPEGGSLDLYTIGFGASAWPNMSASIGTADRASITSDGGSRLLVVAFDYGAKTIYSVGSVDGGLSWGPPTVISTHESGDPLVDYPGLDASTTFSSAGTFTVGWTTGSGPYNVRVYQSCASAC